MYTDPCTIAMQSDMNQLKELIQEDLATFMDEMAPPLEICVDWVCDRFALDCDDALIDFVADCYFENQSLDRCTWPWPDVTIN